MFKGGGHNASGQRDAASHSDFVSEQGRVFPNKTSPPLFEADTTSTWPGVRTRLNCSNKQSGKHPTAIRLKIQFPVI